MDIITNHYYYSAFDGRILLDAKIDSPSKNGSVSSKYLREYSAKSELFVREKLFLTISDSYNKSYLERSGTPRFSYTFSIKETYSRDGTESYLMNGSLSQNGIVIALGVDGVIFCNDAVVPAKLICKRREARNNVLILTESGAPSVVTVEKCRLHFKAIDSKAFFFKRNRSRA